MELTKRQKTIKYFCYCLVIIIADLLQNTSGLFPEIFGARCFLLLPVAVIFAMGEDMLAGAFIGLFSGLLWDLTASVHLGFNCIYITVICFIASALVSYIVRDTFVTSLISCIAATVLYCLLYWLLFIVIRGVDSAEMTILSFYIPSAVYTAAVTPLLYFILRRLKKYKF